jgi:hypothetical protein
VVLREQRLVAVRVALVRRARDLVVDGDADERLLLVVVEPDLVLAARAPAEVDERALDRARLLGEAPV